MIEKDDQIKCPICHDVFPYSVSTLPITESTKQLEILVYLTAKWYKKSAEFKKLCEQVVKFEGKASTLEKRVIRLHGEVINPISEIFTQELMKINDCTPLSLKHLDFQLKLTESLQISDESLTGIDVLNWIEVLK